MDFALSSEQQLLLDSVAAWLKEAVLPAAREADQQAVWPLALWDAAIELGLTAILAPEEADGLSLGMLELCLVLQALSRGSASLALAVAAQNLAAACLEPERARRLVYGEEQMGLAWSRPGTAEVLGFSPPRTGAGQWLLLLAAEPLAWSHAHAEIEPCEPASSLMELSWYTGLAPSSTAAPQSRAPRAQLLMSFAAVALGVAEQSCAQMARYALERRQFERSLSEFQDIQWMIADSAVSCAAARHQVVHAALAWDKGCESVADTASARAWLLASKAASLAVGHGVQVHGGYGYTKDYPIERLFRQAQVLATLPWSMLDIKQLLGP